MMTHIFQDQSPLRRLSLVLMMILAAAALSGCGIFSPDESNDEDDGGGAVVFPPAYVSDGAAGREQLIDNLELAYEKLNLLEYDKLLHELYVFRIDPTELDAVGQLDFSRAEDYDSTEAMFSGETGQERILDSNGDWTGDYAVVPPVQTISLNLDPASGSAWVLMDDGEFVGSWRKAYEVDMRVTYSGDPRIDQISGQQFFYLLPGTIEENGVTLDVWQIRAWEDQGVNSGS